MTRSLFRNEQGNVLALTALVLPLLVGCLGLTVDMTQWVLAKRRLQQAADSAAVAGVYGTIQTGTPESAVDRILSQSRHSDFRLTTQVTSSPAGYDGDPFAVEVLLSAPVRTTFSSMFLQSPLTVSAQATATIVENGQYCAFAIGSGDAPGVLIKAGSKLELECGLATNASSSAAIKADGSSQITAPAMVAYGGIEGAGSDSGARSYGLKQKDPFANTEPPEVPSSGCPNVTVNSDASTSREGKVSLKPGCYGNMSLNGAVNLEPGEYVLNRGNLIVGPNANVVCNGCSFFLTSQDAATDPGSVGKVKISELATVKLAAPKAGPNAGVLLYQDRRASVVADGQDNIVGGNSFSELIGLLYFPSETLRLDVKMAPDMRCARLVGRRLIIEGRLYIAKDCQSSGNLNFSGTEARLVR